MTDLDAIRARDAAADRCLTCGKRLYASVDDDPYHRLTVEECTRERGRRGPCIEPEVHHAYAPGGVASDPWDDEAAADRRALLAEVDRLREVLHGRGVRYSEGIEDERARSERGSATHVA